LEQQIKSVLAFEPKKAGIPPAIMVDRDQPGARGSLSDYRAVVQNLSGRGVLYFRDGLRRHTLASHGDSGSFQAANRWFQLSQEVYIVSAIWAEITIILFLVFLNGIFAMS